MSASESAAKLGIFKDKSACKVRTLVKVVLFDVFGTVVDWRGSLNTGVKAFFESIDQTSIDHEKFVLDWATSYSNAMKSFKAENGFKTVDELLMLGLKNLLKERNLQDSISLAQKLELHQLWHQLNPWPDSSYGLIALNTIAKTGTLSNGNLKLLKDLASHGKLAFTHFLSGENFKKYKPAPDVYIQAAKALGLKPEQIMLAASHKYDLDAAKKLGFQTAYIYRPNEFDCITGGQAPAISDGYDFQVESITELADQLRVQLVRSSPTLGVTL